MTATTSPRYYVGDLAYVLNDTDWDEVCWTTPFDNSEHEFEFEDGREFILFSTAYGDGVYNDGVGNPYCVDSGTIGAIRAEYLDSERLTSVTERGLGHVHEFPAEIDGMDCFFEGGVIHIYTVAIDTAGGDWEEE